MVRYVAFTTLHITCGCRATLEQLQFWGRWVKNTVTESYLSKHPAVNLLGYALMGGWGHEYMQKHYNYRLDVEVSPACDRCACLLSISFSNQPCTVS